MAELQRPQLTISLLASNRPDSIRKCLDSLRPIMEAISSELILIDTSKNAEIHEILLEYTNQVYEFDWCNDFSKARNEGLKRAKGEWFLYLDDDEWFVEIDELIRFFQSGEYKDYGYANYIVRNFFDPEYTHYSDSWVSRMFKVYEDSTFKSKVHEYVYPIRGKEKNIDVVAYHSGYIYATEEQKRAHFERNANLLLDMIKEEPENLRWKVQLAQEYRAIENYDKLKEFCEQCLIESQDIDDSYDNVHIGTFYAGLADCFIRLKSYESVLDVCKRAEADGRNTDLCKAYMNLRKAEAYLQIGSYQDAKTIIQQYLLDIEEIRKDEKELIRQQMALLVNEVYDDTNMIDAYSLLIAAGLKLGSTSELHQYYEKLGWDK